MKNNKIMWGLVFLMVLVTITISYGTRDSYSQQDDSVKQESQSQEDLTKYLIVYYDAPKPTNPKKLKQREIKNKQYDKYLAVVSKPHHETDGVILNYDEMLPSETIPTEKSNLIVTGQIVSGEAFLSNDKRAVYSEYTVAIEEILKGDNPNFTAGSTITIDRFGGYVRYPNGQKVLYEISELGLPTVGSRYVLFLKTSGQSPNYQIITGYEIKEDIVKPLDDSFIIRKFREKKEKEFKEEIRSKISKSSKPVKN
ncbi:MAG: hypothetical protein M3405_06860 [Acidobacteriota bacterium]|nr:hypothetical protein [Acidobacteriota bacterium]